MKWMLTLSATAFVMAGAAFAQPTAKDDGWTPLTNEISRGQLFTRYAVDKAKQEHVQSFAFPYKFVFPSSAENDENGVPRKDTMFGIDISHYELKNFPVGLLSSKHVSFIYVKATQGTNNNDAVFPETWKNLAALTGNQRIPRGAFHFLSSAPDQSGTAQANRFLEYVNQQKAGLGELPPALDLEWDVACEKCPDRWLTNHRTAAEIIGTTVEFVARVKQLTGRTTLLYTNKSFLYDVGIRKPDQIAQLTRVAKIWIFDVTKNDRDLELPDPDQNLPHDLWQFSAAGTMTGPYKHGMDIDVFKGTEAQWHDFVSGDAPQTP